jgi:acetyltransferase-like isoleucine patch superfamily enzyme
LLKKFLFSVYFFLLSKKRAALSFLRFKIFHFLIPNLKRISSKRLIYTTTPSCQQKTIITGKGIVDIGENCEFGFKKGGFYRNGCIEIQPRYKNALIKIGNRVITNNNIFICAAKYIEIGDNTLIGQNVTLMDFEAHGIHPDKRYQVGEIGKIIIGKNVWIGNNVTILKNSEIGENTIIATGAVVSGKFSSDVIIGGVPAKIIKDIDC